ncbi:MAG: phage tail protein [Bacteroidota bacterium]
MQFSPYLPGMVIAYSGEIDTATYRLVSGRAFGVCFAPDVRNTTCWVLCDGSTCKISLFPDLFDAIGTLYGGDAATGQFVVPNYTGKFLRGLLPDAAEAPANEDRTNAAGTGATQNGVGSTQENMVQEHQHHYQKSTFSPKPAGGNASLDIFSLAKDTATTDLLDKSGPETLSGSETRPENVYVHYLIYAGRKGGIWAGR